jgi:hypothetical protein
MLLGVGIVTSIVVQALFNISVVLSLVPNKGIPLPFISYGGSSLVPTLFAVGLLLNISKYSSSARGAGSKASGEKTVDRQRVDFRKPLSSRAGSFSVWRDRVKS